jgi:hypothetical protein
LIHQGQERIDKSGGTSYTFVTSGIKAAVEQTRAVAGRGAAGWRRQRRPAGAG